MLIPTDKTELVQLLRDLASAIESSETEYRGCQLMSSMERAVLPSGEYGEASDLTFELRVAVSNQKTHDIFKRFSEAQHYAPRMPS